jgi:two-component system sensor histidine kinase HupT/HoxJ
LLDPPGKGTGLGLSVSYGIVAEHGGRLRAENRTESGARFVLEIPLDEGV